MVQAYRGVIPKLKALRGKTATYILAVSFLILHSGFCNC